MIDAGEDLVELVLNGETVLTCKEYQIDIAYMMAPSQFSIVIGSGTTAIELMRRYPARTTFVLKINGVVQFSGLTDGYERPQGEHTELRITGRDCMSPLLRNSILHDRIFNNATFEDLGHAAIKGAGIKSYTLSTDALAHRKAVTGTPIVESTKVVEHVLLNFNELYAIDSSGFPPGTDLNYAPFDIKDKSEITVDVEKTVKRIKGFKADKPIEWKASTKWYAAAKKEFDRGGIFFRASVDPTGKQTNVFLLSEPSAAQTPLFGFVNTREPDPADNLVSVLPPHITDLVTNRCARYIVRGRTGGGKSGREQIEGIFDDDYMIDLGFDPEVDVDVHIDEMAKSVAQANYLARRRCAEMRRQHRVFTYRVPKRHTAPVLTDSQQRAVLVPDVCVALKDDENGMEGVFWIERVKHCASANGPTYTDVTLMVPEDLVFGDGEFLPGATRRVSGRHRRKKK